MIFGRGIWMNKKQQWAFFCGRLVPVAALAATFFMVLGVLLSYEEGTNYFEANAIIPLLATIWAFLSLASAVAFALLVPKEETLSKFPFGANLLVALPASLGFAISGIFLVLNFAQSRSYLALAAAVALLLAALHVLLLEAGYCVKALGFIPPVACALLVCILYFDTSMEMNAPLKVASQCALIPLMLYFTAELRYLLDRALPRLYLALALASIALSSLCTLAVPVAVFAGLLDNANCLAAAIAVLGANLTVFLKLKRFSTPIPSPDQNDTKETDAQ